MSELSLYQFKDYDLLQPTNGREPVSLEENRRGWRFLEKIPRTPEAIMRIATKSPSKVVEAIDRYGYCG